MIKKIMGIVGGLFLGACQPIFTSNAGIPLSRTQVDLTEAEIQDAQRRIGERIGYATEFEILTIYATYHTYRKSRKSWEGKNICGLVRFNKPVKGSIKAEGSRYLQHYSYSGAKPFLIRYDGYFDILTDGEAYHSSGTLIRSCEIDTGATPIQRHPEFVDDSR